MPSRWLWRADRSTLSFWMLLSRVFTAITRAAKPSELHSFLIFRDFHTYIAATRLVPPPLPQQMSPEKAVLKNSRRWCYSPPAAVTERNRASPPPRHPRGPSYSSGHRCETKTARPFSFVHVYRFRYSLIVMPRSAPATPFCLNAPRSFQVWFKTLDLCSQSMLPPLVSMFASHIQWVQTDFFICFFFFL